MRAEAAQWLASADADLAVARSLQRAKRYSYAAFFSHQAAEKALKAAVMACVREFPPLTHNLRLLAERIGEQPPAEVETAMLRLMPHYTASRYPDAAQGPPDAQYNRVIAAELVRAAAVVRAWAARLCEREQT